MSRKFILQNDSDFQGRGQHDHNNDATLFSTILFVEELRAPSGHCLSFYLQTSWEDEHRVLLTLPNRTNDVGAGRESCGVCLGSQVRNGSQGSRSFLASFMGYYDLST